MRHPNWKTGRPCNCTFGPRIALAKTAAKLDWLRSRPDMQTPQGQAWLDYLEQVHPHADPLYPWLTREMKKNRIFFRNQGQDTYGDVRGEPAPGDAPEYHGTAYKIPYLRWEDPTDVGGSMLQPVVPGLTQHWMDWFNSNHPTRQGVDINSKQFTTQQMKEHVQAWEHAMLEEAERAKVEKQNNAPILHQWPDNWTLRRLLPEHLDYEGNCMGHCVGGFGYHDAVKNGETAIASLRDPQGQPHATMELTPQHSGPEAGLDLERALASHPTARAFPDDLKDQLRSFHAIGRAPNGEASDQDVQNLYYQLWRDPNYHHPLEPPLDNAEIVQVQGKGNEAPKPEYQQRLKDWFQTFPPERRPNWGNQAVGPITHIGEIDPNATTYNASYDEMVHGHPDAAEEGGYGPHGDYGLVEPPREVDYPAVIDSLIRPKSYNEWYSGNQGMNYYRQHHDPNEVKALYQEALRRQQIPQLAQAAEGYGNWANDDYNQIEDQNYDYMPSYPGEEWDEDPEQLQNEYEREKGELPEDPAEREEALRNFWANQKQWYDDSRNELYSEHEPSQLASTLYSYLNPHYGPNGYQNELAPQPPGLAFSKVARGRKPHRNRHGNACYCPFGIPGKMARRVESAKLDWLRERDDMKTPEGQQMLAVLQRFNDQLAHDPKQQRAADKTYPWIVREWRKGRLTFPPALAPEDRGQAGFLQFQNGYGALDAQTAGSIGQYLDAKKKEGQGIDLMQQQAHELVPNVRAWQELQQELGEPEEWRQGLGEVVHKWPDGWTIRQLRDADEAQQEGHDMGNCVGTEDYGYPQAIDSGNMRVYSLRSPANKPHATIAIDPDGSVEQIEDRSGKFGEKYRNRVNEWMEHAGDLSFEGNGKQNRWWDPYYEMDGPANFRELVGHNGDDNRFNLHGYPQEDWYENEPDEYRNAISDAEEQGVPYQEHPELRVDDPDYDSILDSLLFEPASYRYGPEGYKNYPSRNLPYNPEWGQYVLDHAAQHNHIDLLKDALEQREDPDEDWRFPQHDQFTEPTADQRDQEARHYRELLQEPEAQMVNHLMPQIDPSWQSLGPAARQMHPEQQQMFQERQSPDRIGPGDYRPQYYGPDQQPDLGPYQYRYPQYNQPGPMTFSKVAHPLYYRFVFSPVSGEVDLADNSEPDLKLHGDLAAERNEPGLVHGFAYRIGGGWRLFDWEHRPLEDPFVIAQVMRRLRSESEPSEGGWEPVQGSFDRLHHGIPS